MLVVATLGLGVNVIAAWVLATRGGGGINVRGAMMHVLGDALGSVAAIVAGVFLLSFGWRMADPIASLVIAVLILVGGVRLLRETTHVLMEGTPEDLDVHDLEHTILGTPGVSDVHDLHVWALTPGEPMLTAHVVIEPGTHGTQVARHVGQRLRQNHGIDHVTIQPEPPDGALVTLRLRKHA
jgi:cobalt-zinc-cadmium efflux system protein